MVFLQELGLFEEFPDMEMLTC